MFFSFSRYLPVWLKYFTVNETLLVINYAEFKNNLFDVLYKIETYLGLEHKIEQDDVIYSNEKKFYCKRINNKNGMAQCMHSGKGRSHPVMPDNWYHKLKVFYKEGNEKLFQAIGQDFGWNDYFKTHPDD